MKKNKISEFDKIEGRIKDIGYNTSDIKKELEEIKLKQSKLESEIKDSKTTFWIYVGATSVVAIADAIIHTIVKKSKE